MLRFETLLTPPGDGDILIEPPACEWPSLLERNRELQRKASISLAGVPLAEASRSLRREILGLPADVPFLAAGHQPELAHPGVWAKHVVVRHAAETHHWTAFDLVVDNDTPRSNALVVPVVGPDNDVSVQEVGFWKGPAGVPYEHQPAWTSNDLATIGRQLRERLGDRWADSCLPAYLAGLDSSGDAVQQHLAGRAAVDTGLNVDLPEHRVSRAFGGPFLADLLINAERFRAAYNESLADYRHRENVREADRPLPDLEREGDRIETALWIYPPRKHRRRLWLEPLDGGFNLYADSERIGGLSASEPRRDPVAAVAALAPWAIRPRALTLTLWARLLACDLFVHGIGGAKYDRITDEIIRRYYGCEPPAYACVTATLRLPLPRYDVNRDDLLAARQRVRDWRFNPDRYLTDPPADLVHERRRLIGESDRLREQHATRCEQQSPRRERREVFLAIRDVNKRLTDCSPEIGRQLADQASQLDRELRSNQNAESREYFYALQPPERLLMLAARLREHADARSASGCP
jgi:hypothetical protein